MLLGLLISKRTLLRLLTSERTSLLSAESGLLRRSSERTWLLLLNLLYWRGSESGSELRMIDLLDGMRLVFLAATAASIFIAFSTLMRRHERTSDLSLRLLSKRLLLELRLTILLLSKGRLIERTTSLRNTAERITAHRSELRHRNCRRRLTSHHIRHIDSASIRWELLLLRNSSDLSLHIIDKLSALLRIERLILLLLGIEWLLSELILLLRIKRLISKLTLLLGIEWLILHRIIRELRILTHKRSHLLLLLKIVAHAWRKSRRATQSLDLSCRNDISSAGLSALLLTGVLVEATLTAVVRSATVSSGIWVRLLGWLTAIENISMSLLAALHTASSTLRKHHIRRHSSCLAWNSTFSEGTNNSFQRACLRSLLLLLLLLSKLLLSTKRRRSKLLLLRLKLGSKWTRCKRTRSLQLSWCLELSILSWCSGHRHCQSQRSGTNFLSSLIHPTSHGLNENCSLGMSSRTSGSSGYELCLEIIDDVHDTRIVQSLCGDAHDEFEGGRKISKFVYRSSRMIFSFIKKFFEFSLFNLFLQLFSSKF